MQSAQRPERLLGDTPARDYTQKLRLFNAFAAPELRAAIASLEIAPRARIVDAGCGTGEALRWLAEAAGPAGVVVGFDLSAAHVKAARQVSAPAVLVVQADLLAPPLMPRSFDLVWCVNAINHLREPGVGVTRLASVLRSGGRVALGQSSLLPEMHFAWDSRLERATNEAVRQYYRDRYGVDERELAAVRALVGALRGANLCDVEVRTRVIERISPLRPDDEAYFVEAIFRGTWGERLRRYMSKDDYAELDRLCDPSKPEFAPRRADFHFLQTFTLAVGRA